MCSTARGDGQSDAGGSSTSWTSPTKNAIWKRVRLIASYCLDGACLWSNSDSIITGRVSTSSPLCFSDSATGFTTIQQNTNTSATNGKKSLMGTPSPSSSSSSSPTSASKNLCCGVWRKDIVPNPVALLMWPFSLQILLLIFCYTRQVTAEDKLNLIHARLVNMLRTKQSLFYRRQLRSGSDPGLDLRDHRLFISNPKLDCCPTVTEFEPRRTGINPSGIVLELFSNMNFTQSFYETICYPFLRNRPCQFVDPKLAYATRCIQQYSYVYAIGRMYGSAEGFRVDYIRIRAGCKCQIQKQFIRRRKKNVN